MQPRTRGDFEVAIICALPLEADAVQDLFDEYYDDNDDPYGKQPGDPNAYTTGRMGRHHVVLAYMPGMGKASAASVAASLKISFNRIRLALVVGICGAIPLSQKGVEIVLGDVIVSNAVIEYDFGRQYSDGFQRKTGVKDTLGRPDQEIRSILSKLETRRSREQLGNKLYEYLNHLQQQPEIMAKYPGATQDRLFEAPYRHMHHQHPSSPQCLCAEVETYSDPVCGEALSSDCELLGCEGSLIVRRQRDSSTPKPLLHIGMIASASTVVKSAEHRDRIAKKENVIAFEMEGAGVWDSLPCIIVKGVCDYADSHKNKDWQNYAAATGASAARAFLDFWVPNTPVEETRKKGNEHWLVPRKSNPNFTGRGAILRTLKDKLLPPGQSLISTQQVYVLSGIGGSGKSEAAIKFAEETRDCFWGIFWIDASSLAAAKRTFTGAAEACGLQDKNIDTVRNYLANVHKPWLLVLDNCDDSSEDYSYLFPSAQGSVLLTTRDAQNQNPYGESNSLDELIFEDAIVLLLRSAGILEKDYETQEHLATRVVDLLGRHALAIVQAGAYVSSRLCSLEEYPTVFKSNQKELLEYSRVEMQSRYKNVYTTFEVSAKALESSGRESDSAAINLLSILSFFDRQNVEEQVFIRALEHWQEMYRHRWREDDEIDHLSTWHCKQIWASKIFGEQQRNGFGKVRWRRMKWSVLSSMRPGEAKPFTTIHEGPQDLLRRARSRLVKLGILSFATDGSTTMHPLVYLWARTRLEPKDQAAAWIAAGCILAFSTKEAHGYQPFSSTLSLHLESCFDLWSTLVSKPALSLDIARVFFAFCWPVLRVRSTKSIEMARLISAWLETSLASTSSTVEKVQDLEGRCFSDVGEHQHAIPLLQQVVETKMKRLVSNDPVVLTSQHVLAVAYKLAGEHSKAIALLEKIVKIRSQTLAPKDPARLASQHELGSAYASNREYSKAIALLEKIVKTRRQTLAPKDPARLASQHELGSAYASNGEIDKAITLLEEVVDIKSQTLEPEHPSLLVSQHALARAYSQIGEHQKSIKLFEEVLEIESQTLKPEHPDRLASQHQLALAYLKSSDGPCPEAVALLEEVVKIQSYTSKPEHPDRLASQHELALAYLESSDGPCPEAVALLEGVVKIRSYTMKPEHSNRLVSQHALAVAYLKDSDGPHQKAIALLEEVVKIRRQTLKPEHLDRLVADAWLAYAYLRCGHQKQAISLYEQLVKMNERVYGEGHKETLSSKRLLLRARQGYADENGFDDDENEYGDDEHRSAVDENDFNDEEGRSEDAESEPDDNKSESGNDENGSDEEVNRSGNTEGGSHSLVIRPRGR